MVLACHPQCPGGANAEKALFLKIGDLLTQSLRLWEITDGSNSTKLQMLTKSIAVFVAIGGGLYAGTASLFQFLMYYILFLSFFPVNAGSGTNDIKAGRSCMNSRSGGFRTK